MRLSFGALHKRPSLRSLRWGLAVSGILAACIFGSPQRAHALEIELFFPDREHLNLDNPQVSPQDFQGLSSQEREGLGVNSEAELQALVTRLFNDTQATDSNIWDNDEDYRLTIEGCTSVITNMEPGENNADVTLSIRYSQGGNQGCAEISRDNWQIRNPGHMTAAFSWIDAGTIEPVAGGSVSGLFVRSSTNPNQFLRQSEEGERCQDYIEVSGDTTGTFFQLESAPGNLCAPTGFSGEEVFLLMSGNRSIPAGEGAASPDGGAAAADDEETACEESGVLTWFMCPVIKTLDEATDTLDNQIQALLTIPENDYTAPELRTIWARIRNIAFSIFVVIMLVMVGGTALGFEFVSAYTVKRALPRLIIAIMFVTFSWNIMVFLITVTNNVGNGILGLMTSAFAGENGTITLSSLFDGGAVGHIFEAMVTGGSIGGAVLVAKTAPGLVMLFAGTVVLALLVGFIILTLRQLLILALVLVSPLAILAWVFPGNDKLWKIWWQTFSKLLLMFPLLMMVIGAGRVLALVVSQTRTDFADSLVGVLFKLLAYIIPYFFLFALIKLLSPLLNTLSGGVMSLREKAQEGLTTRYAERGKDQLRGRSLARKERIQNWADEKKDKSLANKTSRLNIGGRIFRGAMTGTSKGMGHNLQAEISARRAAKNKEIGDQSATGDDTEIRASVTDKNLVDASRGGLSALENSDFVKDEDYRVGENGRLQLKNISGNWYDASKAQAGQDRWAGDQHAMQKNLSYEMYKSATKEEAQAITDNYLGMTRSMGINDDQAGSMFIGAGYENANSRLEYKHTKLKNGKMVLDGNSFAKEIHEKKDTYSMTKMGSSTIKAMETAHGEAAARAAQAKAALDSAGTDEVARRRAQNDLDEAQLTQQRIRESTATLTARLGTGDQVIGEGEDGRPITGGSSGAAASVENQLRQLHENINGGGQTGSGGGGGGGGRRGGPPPENGGVTPGGIILPPPGYSGGRRAA